MIESFDDFLKNADEYEKEYKGDLCSFFDEHERNKRIRKWKNIVYGIKAKKRFNYKKNCIWEYLNGEVEFEELQDVLRRKS